jgi:excisionase family DNA binding protein
LKPRKVRQEAKDDQLWDYGDVAIRLKTSVRTVKAMVRDGKIPALRINAQLVRFRLSDILAFEEKAMTNAPSKLQMEKASKMIAARHGGAR